MKELTDSQIAKIANRYLKHAYKIIEREKDGVWLFSNREVYYLKYFDTYYVLYWVSLYHKPLSKIFKDDIDKTEPVDWLAEQAEVELDKDL